MIRFICRYFFIVTLFLRQKLRLVGDIHVFVCKIERQMVKVFRKQQSTIIGFDRAYGWGKQTISIVFMIPLPVCVYCNSIQTHITNTTKCNSLICFSHPLFQHLTIIINSLWISTCNHFNIVLFHSLCMCFDTSQS